MRIRGWLCVGCLGGVLASGAVAEESPPKTIRGKVLKVGQDFGIVILDVGELQGVQPGEVFRIYRGDQFVALVRVREVFPGMSAAAVESKASPIQEGDLAANRLLEADTAKSPPAPPPVPPAAAPAVPGRAGRPLVGRVLAVRTLVVVDLGSAAGIRVGQEITVARGGEWIATLSADRVQERMTVASVTVRRSEIKAGDVALAWLRADAGALEP